ncbi:hypothetical protein LMG33818_000437 [Halomonadaceae bacterium LMG 33818]|uniref:hypothetical protein n=1 Tax=Cernens ardua TaxID=3402176 RepID=UPI003EDC6D79
MSAITHVLKEDMPLVDLLERASDDDLVTLVNYLTNFGRVRVTMAADAKRQLLAARDNHSFSRDDLLVLVHELEHYGGNSVINRLRRQGVPYRTIVHDVAAYLEVDSKQLNQPTEVLEKLILEKMLEEHWKRLPDGEKSRFGELLAGVTAGRVYDPRKLREAVSFDKLNWSRLGGLVSDYIVPGIRKNGFSYFRSIRSIGSKVLGARALGSKAMASRLLPVSLPVAVAGGAAYGAYRLSRESYRITVPCVVQIATIRQKAMSLPGSAS